jgi:hypothetical protein
MTFLLIINSLMIKILALLALVVLSTALPYADQMALANSLIVGR